MASVLPFAGTLLSLLLVALILSVTWITNFLFSRLVIGAIWKRNRSLAYEVSSVGGIVIWTAGVLLTLPVLGASDTVVSVVILLVGGFLILATRDFASNWFAGQTIKKIAPFKVGDWIRTPSTYGRVVKIDDLYTTLVTPENESVAIPNGKLTSDLVVDRSGNGPIKVPIEVDVPSDLGIATVSMSMGEITRELSRKFSDIGEDSQPEIYVVAHSANSVRIKLMLRITNPANEEEAKSEFRQRLAALHWPEPLVPPP